MRCKVCGSQDINVSNNGFYFCMNCGQKYDSIEAQQLNENNSQDSNININSFNQFNPNNIIFTGKDEFERDYSYFENSCSRLADNLDINAALDIRKSVEVIKAKTKEIINKDKKISLYKKMANILWDSIYKFREGYWLGIRENPSELEVNKYYGESELVINLYEIIIDLYGFEDNLNSEDLDLLFKVYKKIKDISLLLQSDIPYYTYTERQFITKPDENGNREIVTKREKENNHYSYYKVGLMEKKEEDCHWHLKLLYPGYKLPFSLCWKDNPLEKNPIDNVTKHIIKQKKRKEHERKRVAEQKLLETMQFVEDFSKNLNNKDYKQVSFSELLEVFKKADEIEKAGKKVNIGIGGKIQIEGYANSNDFWTNNFNLDKNKDGKEHTYLYVDICNIPNEDRDNISKHSSRFWGDFLHISILWGVSLNVRILGTIQRKAYIGFCIEADRLFIEPDTVKNEEPADIQKEARINQEETTNKKNEINNNTSDQTTINERSGNNSDVINKDTSKQAEIVDNEINQIQESSSGENETSKEVCQVEESKNIFVRAFKSFFLGGFSGRCSLKIYWISVLEYFFLFFIPIVIIDAKTLVGFLTFFLLLLSIAPILALFCRRLHDLNLSGWFVLFGLLGFAFPPIFALILIPLALVPGSSKENRFGPPS